jgi:hypothetical protein
MGMKVIQFAYPTDSINGKRYLKMVIKEVNSNCSSFTYDGSVRKVLSIPYA